MWDVALAMAPRRHGVLLHPVVAWQNSGVDLPEARCVEALCLVDRKLDGIGALA